MKRTITALAGGVLLTAATACGSSSAASHASPANTRVCEHYRTQRAIVLGDATPNLADATKIIGWIAADQVQAKMGTPLARDLGRMLVAMQGHGGSTHAASKQVLADCEAIGVKFTR